MSALLSRADDMLQRLRVVSAGKNSDQVVGLTGADVDETIELVRDLARELTGRLQRPKKTPGLTSRSKRNRRPDTPYLAFVRRHPCCVCTSRTNVRSHHAGLKRHKGTAMKPPDARAIPLCDDCHNMAGDSFHNSGQLPHHTPEESREFIEAMIAELQAEWATIQDENTF